MAKTSWLRRLKRFLAGEPLTASARRVEESYPRYYPLRLEDRQVLDGVPLVQMDPQGMVVVSAGAAANDGAADTFEAIRVDTHEGARLQIKVNHETAAEFRFDDVKNLRVEGSSDADTLIVDASAVPLGGVEFVANATTGPIGAPGGPPGLDRLVVQGAAPPTSATEPLVHQISTDSGSLVAANWRVDYQGVESVVDELVSVDGGGGLSRQVIAAPGLTAELRQGDQHGAGWTTVDVGATTVEFRNTFASLGVTATHVTLTGPLDLQGASLRIDATDSLRVDGALTNTGGSVELRSQHVQVAGSIDVGARGFVWLDGGSTGIVDVSGAIFAVGAEAGERGGTIQLTGDFVRLRPTARLDATGDAGGGAIWIGRSSESSPTVVPNSRGVWLEAGSTVDAGALRLGDGGTVMVWGNEGIVVEGLIRAMGGRDGGDGGFVETSSLGVLSISAAPLVGAPQGRGGRWLIDPTNLEIVAGPGSVGFTFTGVSPTLTFTSSNAPPPVLNQLSVATLLTAMADGVTVELVTGAAGPDAGDITLSTNLDYNGQGAGTLKLTAHRSIIINGQIFDSAPGGGDSLNLVFTSGVGAAPGITQINAAVQTQGGHITVVGDNFQTTAGGSITTAGGNLTVATSAATDSVAIAAPISLGAGNLTLTTDLIELSGAANSISGSGAVLLQPLSANRSITLGGAAAADFSLVSAELATLADGFSQITVGRSNGTGGVQINGATFRDSVLIRSPSAGTINVDGTLSATGGASITIDGAGATTVLSADVVTAGGAIVFSDNVIVDAAVTVDSTNGGAVPTGATIDFQGTVNGDAGGPESLTVRGRTIGAGGTAGDVLFQDFVGTTETLDALTVFGYDVEFQSAVRIAGPIAVTTDATLTFDDTVDTTSGGTVVLTNGGLLSMNDSFTLDGAFLQNGAGAVSLTGDVTTTNDTIRFTRVVTLVDGVVIDSSSGAGTGAEIRFDADVVGTNATQTLTLDAGSAGNIQADSLGTGVGVARLGGLTITAANAVLIQDVATAGGMTATVGRIQVVGALNSWTSPVTITATSTGVVPSVTLDDVDTRGQNLTINSADDVQFTGGANSVLSSVAGGTFTLQGTTAATTIGLGTGAAGTVSLSDASIAAIGGGFSGGIVFGQALQSGEIELRGGSHAYRESVTIRSGGGAVVDLGASVSTTEGGATNKNFSITGVAGTDVLLGGNVSTDNGTITIAAGDVRVGAGGPWTLASSGGTVNLAGVSNLFGTGAGSGLIVDSRNGGVDNGLADDGSVFLPSVIGGTAAGERLASFEVATERGVTTLGGGATTVTLYGVAGQTALRLDGDTRLTGDTTFSVAPGDVDLSSAVLTASGGSHDLTIDATRGGTVFGGVVTLGEVLVSGGFAIQNLTVTTLAPGGLVFDHTGAGTLNVDIEGDFLHDGDAVTIVDDLALTTDGGDVTLEGDVSAGAAGASLLIDATGGTGGTIDVGPIGNAAGDFLNEVRLTTGGVDGLIVLDDDIAIDDPSATSLGVVLTGRTELTGNVTIRSQGGVGSAARPINLSAADLFASTASNSLDLDASAPVGAAGTVTLGDFGDDAGSAQFVQVLRVLATGATDGDLRLTANVLLNDDGGGGPALFRFTGRDVIATNTLVVDTDDGDDAVGGEIDWGTSRVSAGSVNRALTLDARGALQGGDVTFGPVGSAGGGAFLSSFQVLTNGSAEIQPLQQIRTDRTAASVLPGVALTGDVRLREPPGGTLVIDTEQGGNFAGSAILLVNARIDASNPGVNLFLDSGGSTAGGPVTLGDFTPRPGGFRVNDLTISAAGATRGDVTIDDDVLVDGTVQVLASRNIVLNQDLATPGVMTLDASGQIAGPGELRSSDLTLTAGTLIDVNVETPRIDARTTAGGASNVIVDNSFAGPVIVDALIAAGSGSVDYAQTGGGSLLIAGDVTTAGSGDIAIAADGSITLGSASLIRTQGAGSTISVIAGTTLTFIPGAIVHVGAASPGTDGLVSGLPPTVVVTPTINGSGTNVDDFGDTEVTVTVDDLGAQGFRTTIDWGDGTPDSFNGNTSPTAVFTHNYTSNPNPDPTAPIPINVTVEIHPDITLAENGGATDLGVSTQTVELTVNGSFFAFTQVVQQALAPTPRATVLPVVLPAPLVRAVTAVSTEVVETSSPSVSANEPLVRRYVLRIVLPEDPNDPQPPIELPLAEEELDDLAALFRPLPDGRYQVWMILEDGVTRQLVKDVYVRDGKAIDLEDLSSEPAEGIEAGLGSPAETGVRERQEPADRSGGRGAERAGPRGLAPPVRAPGSSAPGSSSSGSGLPSGGSSSDRSDRPPVDREASLDWSQRAQEALREADERTFSKARRLLRRGSV